LYLIEQTLKVLSVLIVCTIIPYQNLQVILKARRGANAHE
jgi:hypothetical protein